MVITAISIFNMKMYNLFFFGTEERLDLNNIERTNFDVKMTQIFKVLRVVLFLYTGKTPQNGGNSIIKQGH